MAPKKWIDKKTAQSFSLVHRSHEDPLYNDEDASERVLVHMPNLNNSKSERKYAKPKIKTVKDLEQDIDQFKLQGRRDNEGQAALFGIEYDDSRYDYMQHLKSIGSNPDAIFIDKKSQGLNDKGAKKGVDVMFKADYAARSEISLPKEILPSDELVKKTYQDQQNVPDAIAGFQPDMDPDLREVLEALEDEEFLAEDEDEVLFSNLISGGVGEGDNEGFDNDDFADSDNDLDHSDTNLDGIQPSINDTHPDDNDWEESFRQFKIHQERLPDYSSDFSDSEGGDVLGTLASFTPTSVHRRGNRKKKSGASTNLSSYSMSSSAMFRNEGLSLLDDRFDKVEQEYFNDEEQSEDQQQPFDLTNERPDLESIMDDFLNNFSIEGKKLIKK